MGINRFSDIEERKRNETDAKAGDELPREKKGDPSSRLQASEGPAENPEKRRALEKLKDQDQESERSGWSSLRASSPPRPAE
jgi:hypothetical protein